jgi:hypothetical protein
MSIQAWCNGQKVVDKDNHKGRVHVTRRERKLIDEGKLDSVEVIGSDGLHRVYLISDLTEYSDRPKCCSCGTEEGLREDGWYGHRCGSPDCMVY